MADQNQNPFILPAFGQSGDMSKNPMMASMDMMRQAWQGLANSSGFGHSSMAVPTSLEDLDRRISDLRAVENWLRMNLSMLSSTIQGIEVQRATIATLKTFMTSAGAVASASAPSAGASPDGRSPLEVVLGIQPGAGQPPGEKGAERTQPPKQEKAQNPDAGLASGEGSDAYAAQAAAAAEGWWDMVQKQFDNLAAATTASLQSAEALRASVAEPTGDAKASGTAAKSRKARKTTSKTASDDSPPKRAAKKTAARRRST